MKIGLDFDGVIADYSSAKAKAAERLFGLRIEPSHMHGKRIVNEGTLSLEQYRRAQELACLDPWSITAMQPIPGAVEALFGLLRDHEIRIITSRHAEALKIARQWLRLRKLECPVIGVGYGVSKEGALQGEQVFVDDGLHKLSELTGAVPHLFLFGPQDAAEVPDPIRPVLDWEALLTAIGKIAMG